MSALEITALVLAAWVAGVAIGYFGRAAYVRRRAWRSLARAEAFREARKAAGRKPSA